MRLWACSCLARPWQREAVVINALPPRAWTDLVMSEPPDDDWFDFIDELRRRKVPAIQLDTSELDAELGND